MKLLLFFIIVIVLYLINVRVDKYYWFLPSVDTHDNASEISKVSEAVRTRTSEDVRFHQLTDRSVSPAFLQLLERHRKTGHTVFELDQLIVGDVPTIIKHKLVHNRSRPWQTDPSLDRLPSVSANTPAYPSGHAYQAWVLYHKLSKKYPELETRFYQLAEQCAHIRVIAGLHYPSDGSFAKTLVSKKYGSN